MLSRTIKNFRDYNKAVVNLDLESLLNPDTLKKLPMFPKKKKTYRTLSLAKELRQLGKTYWYFNDNSIVLESIYKGNYRKKTVLIIGSESCYKVRVDVWYLAGVGNFYYKEFDYVTGASILFELVCNEILDQTFIHSKI